MVKQKIGRCKFVRREGCRFGSLLKTVGLSVRYYRGNGVLPSNSLVEFVQSTMDGDLMWLLSFWFRSSLFLCRTKRYPWGWVVYVEGLFIKRKSVTLYKTTVSFCLWLLCTLYVVESPSKFVKPRRNKNKRTISTSLCQIRWVEGKTVIETRYTII